MSVTLFCSKLDLLAPSIESADVIVDVLPIISLFNCIESDSNNIVPTSMIDISDGLSSEILHICKNSNVGCNVYEEKIPVSEELKAACNEFKLHPTTVAMSGGEDYELLFTINQKDYGKIKNSNDLTIIGHITSKTKEANLITKAEQEVPITAQGWKSF